MKHAYLILAHNEFDVLRRLVLALDSTSNDIYVHIDKRIKTLPSLHADVSSLHIIEDRVKSFWGDVSLAEAELNLLAAAIKNGPYDYYHIISGTHFPVKKLPVIESYFLAKEGSSVMMPMDTSREEIEMKMGKRHFFLRHLVDKRKWLKGIYHFCWLTVLHFQKKRVGDVSFVTGKASQWCSLTDAAALALVYSRAQIIENYKHSFCCDEFFVRSFLEKQGLPIIFDNQFCYIDFVNTAPRTLNGADYDMLVKGPFLFARKMSSKQNELVDKLLSFVKNG